MPAYIIGRVDVEDVNLIKGYQTATPLVIEQYGGKLIVRGGDVTTLEGPIESRRIVVMEFPSIEHARRFYHSPEYAAAKALREGIGAFEFIAVEGVNA